MPLTEAFDSPPLAMEESAPVERIPRTETFASDAFLVAPVVGSMSPVSATLTAATRAAVARPRCSSGEQTNSSARTRTDDDEAAAGTQSPKVGGAGVSSVKAAFSSSQAVKRRRLTALSAANIPIRINPHSDSRLSAPRSKKSRTTFLDRIRFTSKSSSSLSRDVSRSARTTASARRVVRRWRLPFIFGSSRMAASFVSGG
jgi:hypothetical protein